MAKELNEDSGFNITTVCPFNETQYEWNATIGSAQQSGTRATNGEVAQVTRIIDNVFTEKGVNAKIMIPEAAQLKYLFDGSNNTTNQVNDFFNTSSSNYIGDLKNLSRPCLNVFPSIIYAFYVYPYTNR